VVGIRTDLGFQVRVLSEWYIDNLQYGSSATCDPTSSSHTSRRSS
jgi:hypothetical protein